MKAESHFLRTPGVPPGLPTPRHVAFTSTKVPRFTGRTWIRCVRRPSNESVIPGRGIVPTVGSGLNAICTDMWLHIIWIWASCGGARCPGAPCGRAHHKTVWTMSGGHTMCCGTSSWLVWSSSSHRGLCNARLGRLPQTLPFGVSTDVLLFSDINLSLAHHYRVYKRGLPHLSAGIRVIGNGLGAV